jgi:hypothetical protein
MRVYLYLECAQSELEGCKFEHHGTLVNEGLQIESVSKAGEYELLTDPIVGLPGKCTPCRIT